MNCFQVFECTSLKIELLTERLDCQRFLRVICIENRLLKLLNESLLMQTTEIEAVEIRSSPEFAFGYLLIVNGLIGERHDA